jgi:hypothetical protein
MVWVIGAANAGDDSPNQATAAKTIEPKIARVFMKDFLDCTAK